MSPSTLGSLAMAAAVPVSTTCGPTKTNSMVVAVIAVCAAVRIAWEVITAMAGETRSSTTTIAKGTALVEVVKVVTALEGNLVCEFEHDRGIATLSGLKAQIQVQICVDHSKFRLIHRQYELVDDCSVRRALEDKEAPIQILPWNRH